MNCKELRSAGLPMRSGAIESAIRRVVNLRLKGCATMWRKENAQAMLVIRAAILTTDGTSRLSMSARRWAEADAWFGSGDPRSFVRQSTKTLAAGAKAA